MKILSNDAKTKYASVGTVAAMIIPIVMLSSFSNAFAGGGWGSTWDSIGTIDEVNYPFTGKALTGVQIYYCNDTSTTCTSNQWDYVMFEGTEWDGPQNVDLTNQNVGTWITQNANHLYTSNPYGYAEGDSESCGGTCYGSGETDFGNTNNLSNSNWMLFHNIYANWI